MMANPPKRQRRAAANSVVIHYGRLARGGRVQTACGYGAGKAPSEWDEGHVWTRDSSRTTCTLCQRKL